MTLIAPVGENSLPFVCDGDDADSGFLARSPDDIVKEDDFSDECVTPSLRRHSSSAGGDDRDVPSSKSVASDDDLLLKGNQETKGASVESPSVSSEESSFVKRAELKISLNCDKKVTSVPPLVIYECKITLDSVPKFSHQMDQSTKCFESLGPKGDSCKSEVRESEESLNQTRCENPQQTRDSSLVPKDSSSVSSTTPANGEERARSQCLSRHSVDMETQNFKNCGNIANSRRDVVQMTSNTFGTESDEPSFVAISDSFNVDNPNVKLNSHLVPNEEKKMKDKKLMQRRSISESSSHDSDFGYLKKTREKLRHSFSAYENCDKLQKILDRTFADNVLETERVNNDLNAAFNCESAMEKVDSICLRSNASLEKMSRKSCIEITDTLVNNVKKSMIEEYKNLKKNSSLAKYNVNGGIKVRTESENKEYPTGRVKEAFGNPEAETEDQAPVSVNRGKAIPLSEIRCRETNEGKFCSSFDPTVDVENMSDFKKTNSSLLDDTNANSWADDQKGTSVSSPPTRLEVWKNILAEKRNSIRNHIKGLGKLTDNYARSNNNNNINNNNNNNSDIDNNAHKSQINISLSEELVSKLHQSDLIKSDVKGHSSHSIHIRSAFVHGADEGIPEINPISTTMENFLSVKQITNQGCWRISDNSFFPENTYSDFVSSDYSRASSGEGASPKATAKFDTKIKLREACHGIATALDSLPQVVETSDSLNNNELPLNGLMKLQCNFSKEITQVSGRELNEKIFAESEDWNEGRKSNCINSTIASFITTIPPPVFMELAKNEKGLQCPTPPTYLSDDEKPTEKNKSNLSTSTEDDSDYCQTDECGDDCDYCSGAESEAEDEEEAVCDVCRHQNLNSLSPVCKHTRVMTNGSLKPLRQQLLQGENGNHRGSGSRSMVLQSAFRRRHINHQELSAIREYSITSDDQQDSDEESHDDNMCDISSSWRFGLCENNLPSSVDSTLESVKNADVFSLESSNITRLKSNSLPVSSPRHLVNAELPRRPGSVILKRASNPEDEGSSSGLITGVRLPPRPPRIHKTRHMYISSSSGNDIPIPTVQASNLRPTMGLQGLQQRPSSSKHCRTSGLLTGPKTLAPRSPVNPNSPFGFPNPPSPPMPPPGSPFHGRRSPLDVAPSSPRTNSRSGALVTRNFSISDDEGGQRLSRRQVTITRHESAYKEAADKGYLLPPSSPIDPYWLTWKLGVLQKTVEEVGSRLEESEKIVGAWGPIPQEQNLADQYVHNIRKFRETLPDLQRGIDDVNDQAARFSAHNVPLTPANSAALHDLNNRWKNLETTVNDRWRQMAGRSREVTPLTPAQLASSVSPPWERAAATNKVPYYINHAQETTHWDHPQMMDLLDSLSEFNHIKFSAYRTATKLRSLQKKLALDCAKLQLVTDVFDEHGLRGQNDRLIDVNDMIVVLSTLYGRISSDNTDVNTTLVTDLCLNWLLNVYDSQRTGQMRVLSFRVGLICLCRGHLEEKYRYMFRLIADPNRLVDQRKLGLLLHDCVQVPRQLGEVAAFGGSNIEPSVRSCFTKAGKDRETIEAVHFLTWVQQEPQSLVWLAVLHRVAASESVQHQVKCNICKTYPIVGLRYRCLKCLSFDMCQRCFFEGRSSKSHKITHPMHEYCTATTAGDEMKDFTKALKNKFKSKRSLQKHTKKGYLPVQTVLEGDPLESPSPSPSHNVSSQDMHSRLELYASRLAEVELRTNSNSTPDSEDEHGLIAQYCQSLSSSDAPFPVPKSPLQIMASVDADQKDELEQMIRDLEEENRALQAEYERLKSEQPSGSISDDGSNHRSEAEMLAEAKLLREHKGRLEARMAILEDHNRQLEAQLQRLRQLLVEQSGMGSPNKSGTLQTKSVTASQLAMDSPAKINGHSSQGGSGSAYEGLDQMSEYVRPPPPPVGSIAHMGNLFSRAGDLEKAVGNLVASMNQKKESDSHSDNQSDENDYDNTVPAVQSKSE